VHYNLKCPRGAVASAGICGQARANLTRKREVAFAGVLPAYICTHAQSAHEH